MVYVSEVLVRLLAEWLRRCLRLLRQVMDSSGNGISNFRPAQSLPQQLILNKMRQDDDMTRGEVGLDRSFWLIVWNREPQISPPHPEETVQK